jgi:hypothetical protein
MKFQALETATSLACLTGLDMLPCACYGGALSSAGGIGDCNSGGSCSGSGSGSGLGGGSSGSSVRSITANVLSGGASSIMRPFASSSNSGGNSVYDSLPNAASHHSLGMICDGLSAFNALRVPPSSAATEQTVCGRRSAPGHTRAALELAGEDSGFVIA